MNELDQLKGELESLHRKVDEILRRLDVVAGKPKPHISRTEFAKVVKKHPNTVTRWIDLGRVRTEKGGIPRTELAKFTS